VFFLSSKRGAVRGVRLIIVGIGVSAMLASVNVWILLTATVEDAIMASLWGAGNLSGVSWATLLGVFGGSVLFLLASLALSRPMRLMQIGTPFATALGQNVRVVQVAAIVIGIGLTALATASVGPISFIALAAPQIARRVVRSDGLALGPTAAIGALLLLLADVLAQRIYPDSPLPVGIVTVSIGGLYFLWLLLREGKKR
jgi:iron complex transport system permease protein